MMRTRYKCSQAQMYLGLSTYWTGGNLQFALAISSASTVHLRNCRYLYNARDLYNASSAHAHTGEMFRGHCRRFNTTLLDEFANLQKPVCCVLVFVMAAEKPASQHMPCPAVPWPAIIMMAYIQGIHK